MDNGKGGGRGRVEKPASLVREEFLESLVKLVNGTNLPLFMTEAVLKDFLDGLHQAARQQADADRKEYEKRLEESGAEGEG